MIRYRLRCTGGHEFEGWFRSSATFDHQAATGLVACPECATTEVTRALMAPSVRTTKAGASPVSGEQSAGSGPTEATAPVSGARAPSGATRGEMPDALRAMLSRLRENVERECDYVGDAFADEARRMHRGEIDKRAIYGEASNAERDDLAADGVSIARIPWLPRTDS